MNGGSAISQPTSRRRRPDRLGLALVAVGLLAAACATTPVAEIERAVRIDGPLRADDDRFDRTPDDGSAEPDQDQPPATAPPRVSTIDWGTCDGFGIPDEDVLGTSRWECSRIDVPMNPDDPDGGLPPVSLAVTRHPATGDRFGTIVMNPGGPGGAGLPVVWNLRLGLPPELLRGFDIVSWDPRGVGQSEPAISCPSGAGPDDDDFIRRCVETTGPLSAFLAAPYSVADLEQLRVALGEDRLDYLGYSYGTVLGATYAARHPSHVGSFVLDGATDPDVGSPDGPFDGGFPTFADNGLPEALDRFHELCAATDRCLPDSGDRTQTATRRIAAEASELTTDDHDGTPSSITRTMVDDHLAWSMQSAGEWELLAAALGDAVDGDGSTLAAHIEWSGLLLPEPGEVPPGPDDGSAPDNFDDANFLIYCADVGPFVRGPRFCDDMPAAADRLEPVAAVSLDRDIVVIGTQFDPLTPGYHAGDFADRLGDAVSITWEGVGHTAFPGWTRCIDDAVVDHFLGRAVPADGLRCEFVDGITDDAELADELFGFTIDDGRPWVADSLFFTDRSGDDDPQCLATEIVPDGSIVDEVVAEIILGVTSVEATAALASARDAC